MSISLVAFVLGMARNRTSNLPLLSTDLRDKVYLTIVGRLLVRLLVDIIITPVSKTSKICRGELAAVLANTVVTFETFLTKLY